MFALLISLSWSIYKSARPVNLPSLIVDLLQSLSRLMLENERSQGTER